MSKNNITDLTKAFQNFTGIIEKFQKTHIILKDKIEMLTDQLEKKNKELENQISEVDNIKNFLNHILENVYSGVLVIDNIGNISVFNQAAEEITGFKKENVIGKNYLKIFEGLKRNKTPLFTLTTGKESFHRQKNISIIDGTEKKIEFSTKVIKDKNGHVLGVVETFSDISELKKLQERITHIETLAALGEMAASVAHEIRNPLGGIGGFAGLLDRQLPKADPRRKFVKPIIEGVTRLNNIVMNLLSYTRPQKLMLNEVSLHDSMDEIIDFFTISLSNFDKNVIIKKEYYHKEIKVKIDPQLFQQVVTNILKNAFDAIKIEGTIEIKTSINVPLMMNDVLDEDEMEELLRLFSSVDIEISDTGKGIPQEILPKLFNPFFTTKDDGNGLGLAICKKIVQLHKGDILVKSQKDVGTTFTISLPLYDNYEEKNTNS